MARLYKCYGEDCINKNLKYEKELLIEDGGKRYCKSCLDKKIREIKERNELYNTIKQLYKIPYPTGMMLRQIKNYKEEFGYTYKGMDQTLRYINNDDNKITFNHRYGLGIITYRYDEAAEFYLNQEKAAKVNMFKNDNIEEITVISNRPNNINRIKEDRIIDLGGLYD